MFLSVCERREMEDLIETYKALADETRLRILGLVAERPHTGWQLAEALRVSQPVVSHHVDKLKRAGLLREVREGKERVYGLNRDTLTRLAREQLRQARIEVEDDGDRVLRDAPLIRGWLGSVSGVRVSSGLSRTIAMCSRSHTRRKPNRSSVSITRALGASTGNLAVTPRH